MQRKLIDDVSCRLFCNGVISILFFFTEEGKRELLWIVLKILSKIILRPSRQWENYKAEWQKHYQLSNTASSFNPHAKLLTLVEDSEQIEVGECLLFFGAESFVFQFAIQIVKDQDIQKYNIALCSACV